MTSGTRVASGTRRERRAFTWNRYELGAALARLIDERRRELGISQRELARRSGVSQAAISTYRLGEVIPSVHVLVRLATTLGLSLRLTIRDGVATLEREPGGKTP